MNANKEIKGYKIPTIKLKLDASWVGKTKQMISDKIKQRQDLLYEIKDCHEILKQLQKAYPQQRLKNGKFKNRTKTRYE